MEIRLASLLQGAQEAVGTTIIIDVFRAFTTAAVAFDRGATQIVLVAEVDEALALRRRGVCHCAWVRSMGNARRILIVAAPIANKLFECGLIPSGAIQVHRQAHETDDHGRATEVDARRGKASQGGATEQQEE